MPTFPTLTIEPEPKMWVHEIVSDPAIRSGFESGAISSRARFTSALKKWSVKYNLLTETDKVTLETFTQTVNYSDSFSWTNPEDDLIYTVRFNTIIRFSILHKPNLWSAEFELVEASPNSSNALMVETTAAANFDLSISDITLVGTILNTGDQADGSDVHAYFEFGVNSSDLITTDYSAVLNVSDVNQNAVARIFALESNVLTSTRDFYYRAVLVSEDGSDIGYGVLQHLTSDQLGY